MGVSVLFCLSCLLLWNFEGVYINIHESNIGTDLFQVDPTHQYFIFILDSHFDINHSFN